MRDVGTDLPTDDYEVRRKKRVDLHEAGDRSREFKSWKGLHLSRRAPGRHLVTALLFCFVLFVYVAHFNSSITHL